MSAFDEMYEADTNYYRLNIWGMSTMRRIMDDAGLLEWSDAGEWPDVDEEDPDAAAKVREWKSRGAGDDQQVPAYKFGSNDGWIVTPDECRVIAAKLREFANPITTERTDRELRPGGPYVRMEVMYRVLRSLGKGDIPTDFDRQFTQTMVDSLPEDAMLEGPNELPSVRGEPSDDPSEAAEQVREVVGWIQTTLSFARFNEVAARRGGYEVR
jgi:hypothetical protein